MRARVTAIHPQPISGRSGRAGPLFGEVPFHRVDSRTAAMMAVRAVRGAIQIDRDDPDLILAETGLLLKQVICRNALTAEDIISVFFTMTPDLASGFPAAAARRLGLTDVPLLCATEIGVRDAMERVIRLLAHIQTDRPRSEIEHVYLRGAIRLRPDLAQRPIALSGP